VKRRALTVVLAVLLAMLGTGGVLIYVHQADARALAGQQAVAVLVAEQLIPAGTSAGTARRDGLLSSQRLPAAAVPADAVRSITPGLSALVLSADVQSGQLILRPMLVLGTQVTGALAIPSGMVAVTIQVCTPEAVAGYLHAGSDVAVFDTVATTGTLSAQPNCALPHQQQSGAARTRIVLPQVQVLSVGSAAANAQAGTHPSTGAFAQGNSASSAASASSPGVLVTLAVSQANAERLILLTQTGLPYLALLSSTSKTKFDTTLVPLFQP